jgi:hypothetical protein
MSIYSLLSTRSQQIICLREARSKLYRIVVEGRETLRKSRESTAFSTDTVDSLTPGQRLEWRHVRKQMQSAGITPEFFNKHNLRIMAILRGLTSDGELEAIVDATANEQSEDTLMGGLPNSERDLQSASALGQDLAAAVTSLGFKIRGITGERTPSSNFTMADVPYEQTQPKLYMPAYKDEEAARRVQAHLKRLPYPSDKHERFLRKLIKPDDTLDGGVPDDDALDSILTAADSVFFDGVLSGRVQWEWSSQYRYRNELTSSTALRRCLNHDRFETLIVLSEPILKNPRYDRRLLLSIFLHELIHCYLFILCGFDAKRDGGHTNGFHIIARTIEDWEGGEFLNLSVTKTTLDDYRKK